MANNYVVYTREPIDETLFALVLDKAGGTMNRSSDANAIRQGQIGGGDADGSMLISLCRDPMLELDEEEDQMIFESLGGAPGGAIEFEPNDGDTEGALHRFLTALAGEVDFFLTDFEEINVYMDGSDIRRGESA